MTPDAMLVPFYDHEGNVIGAETKFKVHTQGLWHRSTLLAIVQHGQVLCQVRRAEKHAGLLDLFGGHEAVSDNGSPHQNAFREAGEELTLSRGATRVPWNNGWLQVIGSEGILVSETPTNRERTTIFGVHLADDIVVSAHDELDSGAVVEVEIVPLSVQALEDYLRNAYIMLADGLKRLLSQMKAVPEFRRTFADFVAGRPAIRGWKLNFACTLPGEPGCGCPDGDFFASHDFVGTHEEAEAEARELSWRLYHGDFRHWIEPA